MNRRPSQSRNDYDAFSPRRAARFHASTPDARFFDARKRRPWGFQLLGAALVVLALLLLFNVLVNQFIHVSRVSVPVRGLPQSFDGYTLLHVSDLKGESFGSEQQLLSFALGDSAYDAVVLTGDMVSQLGNAQPLYALVKALRAHNPNVPIYFIAGDSDPEPASMAHATGGSPFAPWVLGLQQGGAQLLSSPQAIQRKDDTLWLTTTALLNLDIDTMQRQFEQQYLRALKTNDENEIELAAHNLTWLEETRNARGAMQPEDGYVALSHVPPSANELDAPAGSPLSRLGLVLCGHYLGGLTRLPLLGPLFVPSQNLPRYGILPGRDVCSGLHRENSVSVYISPGLGSSSSDYPPFFFRLINPPTVTLVTLTPSAL